MASRLPLLALWAFLFASTISSSNGQDPVKLSVYYESLCPDSQKFMVTQMYPVWLELKDIMLMDIYFYGKATDTPAGEGYTFECQHGPEECLGNLMLTCAKKYMAEDVFLAFSNCVMDAFTATEAGPLCAEAVGVDYTETDLCWQSVEGQQLLHDVGLIQATLNPPLNYVPWILINDQYSDSQLEAAQLNLKQVICEAYTGVTPPACSV